MITTIHGSALDFIEFAPEFDAMIVDPPYSPHVHARATSANKGKEHGAKRELGFEALTPDLRDALARMAAGVKAWSCICSDLEGLDAWRVALEHAGAEYIRAIPWVRWAQPQISGDRPPSGAELVIVAHSGRNPKEWFGPGNLTHFDAKAMRGEDKHPTEKPLDLMLALVAWFSAHGRRVIDPCAGAGTTGVAAGILGRDAVLIEADECWAAVAGARCLRKHTPAEAERVRRFVERAKAVGAAADDPPAEGKGARRAAALVADAALAEGVL